MTRLGLIVPSSNVTIETELPELFTRREGPERFTFHSARVKMTEVTPKALAAMNERGEQAAADLADADCDAVAYACLVAVMAAGPGAHNETEERLSKVTGSPVLTSAGALIRGAHALGANKLALIAPYAPALTDKVIAYLADAGIEVVSSISLNVTDNRAVGRLDPADLLDRATELDLRDAQALVLSACVQMPSLSEVATAEKRFKIPVFTAATATARALLDTLHLQPSIRNAGALLA